MTQVPINPPPWGPQRDPHFNATHTFEAGAFHEQALPQQAADKGWFYRAEWYGPIVPDTRRCRRHGEIMFPPLDLSPADRALYYTDQQRGMATGPIG